MKTVSLAFYSLVLVLTSSPVAAQIRELKFGGSGEAWGRVAALNVLSDVTTVRGGMQPLELRPDVNVVPIIYGAHDSLEEGAWELWQNPPNPLWEPGIPRFYRGFGNFGPKTPGPTTSVMVDGEIPRRGKPLSPSGDGGFVVRNAYRCVGRPTDSVLTSLQDPSLSLDNPVQLLGAVLPNASVL